MRFATFNIWNSDCGMPERTVQIIKQIKAVNTDIICLQEVKSKAYHHELTAACDYQYKYFCCHENEDEGLSIFSRYELLHQNSVPGAIIASFFHNGNTFAVADVHLTWNSAIKREKEIVKILTAINAVHADYRLILGDFNCSVHSSVHEYLTGQRSLSGKEANPYWYDLAESYASAHNTAAENTLDIKNNPRWKGKSTIETSERFDRIFLQNTYPVDFPTFVDCKTFGHDISAETGFAASDHYGVYVDMTFGDKP